MIRNIIGFPGLGFEFAVNETAFTVFGLKVQWYGIILTTAIVCAFILLYRRSVKIDKIPEDHVINLVLFAVPIAIVGARLTYVLTSGNEYNSFIDVINIRNGGIAVYGSIIFGLLTMLVYCRIKKLNFLRIIDSVAHAEMLGQIIGRWGNFVNGEAYGDSAGVGSLPWRMTIQETKLVNGKWINAGSQITVHPTFLYESLWNLIGFVLIAIFYKKAKKRRDGQILLFYLAWYGLGRGLIEILRTDSLRVFGQKLFVYLGLASFVVCSCLLIRSFIKAKREDAELAAYESMYGNADAPAEDVDVTLTCENAIENEKDEDVSPDDSYVSEKQDNGTDKD